MRYRSLSRSVALVAGGILALAGAAVVARDAAGNAFARTRPDLSLRLDPTHPTALGLFLTERLIRTGTLPLPGSPDARAVSAALRREPLSVDLVRLDASIRASRGETPDTRRLMALAGQVSRRDLLTQMWLIEEAVGRGDIARALLHYDNALTTSRQAPSLLFPVLTQALSEPQIRAGLADYLRDHRPWSDAFLTYAVAKGRPREVAALAIAAAPVRHDPAFLSARSELVAGFANAGDLPGLGSYVATLPAQDRATIRTPGFTVQTTDSRLRPLTWELTDNADLSAVYDGGDRLRITTRSGARGLVARRIVFLSPGTWRWRQKVTVADGTTPPDVRWSGYCADRAGQDPFWTAVSSSGADQSLITVPAGCRAIEFRIEAGSDLDASSQSTLTLSGVALDRVV